MTAVFHHHKTRGIFLGLILSTLLLPGLSQAAIDVPEAPVVLGGTALSQDQIRWYFQDMSDNESGYYLTQVVDGEEQILATAEAMTTGEALYLDEGNLLPETEYCGRYVVAFNDLGLSERVSLPCVTTLAIGQVMEEVDLENLMVDQQAYYAPSEHLGNNQAAVFGGEVPLVIFVLASVVGVVHAHYRYRKEKALKDFLRMFGSYFVAGVILSGSMMVVTDLVSSQVDPIRALDDRTPVSDNVVLQSGEIISIDVRVVNTSQAVARNVKVVGGVSEGGQIKRDSIILATSTLPSDGGVSSDSQVVLGSMGDLPPGCMANLSFDIVVGFGQSEVTSTVSISGDNIDTKVNTWSAPIEQYDDVETHSGLSYLISPFSLIATEASPNYYMVDENYRRRLFTDDQIFATWYSGDEEVQRLTPEEMATVPLGIPMLPRPGTLLVRTPADGKIYAVEPDRVARWIKNESQLVALYGSDWELQVMDLDTELFKYLEFGKTLGEDEYPNGYLAGNGDLVCYFEDQTCWEITPSALELNRLSSIYIRSISDADLAEVKIGAEIIDYFNVNILAGRLVDF